MEIFTAIVTAIISICSTLGISKFFRTREEKNSDNLDNNQKTIDMMQDVLETYKNSLNETNETLKQAQAGLAEQHHKIINYALENKNLAIKITQLELLYCGTRDCIKRDNPYRTCANCPDSDTCTLKNIREEQ